MTRQRRTDLARWRSNPLCRRSDVAEAWVRRVTAGVLVGGTALTGIGVGAAVHDSELDAAEAQQAERRVVPARLQVDAPAAEGVTEDTADELRYSVPVRWTAPDGSDRSGTAPVRAGADKGDTVRIWVDRQGRPAEAPLSQLDVWAHTVVAGAAAGGGVSLAVGVVRFGTLWVMNRRRMAAWEQEWQRVGPGWGGYSSRA